MLNLGLKVSNSVHAPAHFAKAACKDTAILGHDQTELTKNAKILERLEDVGGIIL